MTYGPIANEASACKHYFTVIYNKKCILSQKLNIHTYIYIAKTKISKNSIYPYYVIFSILFLFFPKSAVQDLPNWFHDS